MTPLFFSLILALSAAEYEVKLVASEPPRLHVIADLPIAGNEIRMTRTRPGDVPEILEQGWPALIRDLQVTDDRGKALTTSANGPSGWLLNEPHHGRIRIAYDVDYSLLAARGWPARREAAFADATHIVAIGRSLFITTPQTASSTVKFKLLGGWRVATPWLETAGRHTVSGADDLVDNLTVLTTEKVETVVAGNLEVLMVPIGHWRDARTEIRRVLRGAIPQLSALMPLSRKQRYLTVLLPLDESSAESFRRSMAVTIDGAASGANVGSWGNTIAHEVFHTWNGWSLTPADYATSQWFHEGVTEYAANLASVRSGVISGNEFQEKLAQHVRNYRKLQHPLGAKVTGKGPPLYSAGALNAFAWDVLIREATDGGQDLSFFLRNLWKQTNSGARPYDRNDLRAALAATASYGWDAFFAAHIDGAEELPLHDVFARVGLRLSGDRGAERLDSDPVASPDAKTIWRSIVKAR